MIPQRERDDQPIGPLAFQEAHIAYLLFHVFISIAKDQRVAAGIGNILHASHDTGKVGIGNIGDDQANGMTRLLL